MLRSSPSLLGDAYPAIIDLGRSDHNAPRQLKKRNRLLEQLLIAQGAHAKEIAERLGHSTTRLTLDRYGHLLPSLDERLREGLEATYWAAAAGPARDQCGTSISQIAGRTGSHRS